jgi:hypothetical protein
MGALSPRCSVVKRASSSCNRVRNGVFAILRRHGRAQPPPHDASNQRLRLLEDQSLQQYTDASGIASLQKVPQRSVGGHLLLISRTHQGERRPVERMAKLRRLH